MAEQVDSDMKIVRCGADDEELMQVCKTYGYTPSQCVSILRQVPIEMCLIITLCRILLQLKTCAVQRLWPARIKYRLLYHSA